MSGTGERHHLALRSSGPNGRQQVIYLDNNSTTPIDPEVLDVMLPYFTVQFGNPSNTLHDYGVQASEAVEIARAQVAAILGASPRQVVFTSGATESNNLAILGACRSRKSQYDHVITTASEHKAVLEACRRLEAEGFRVTYLPVDCFGMVSPNAVEQAITKSTLLVSVMGANNEVGTLQPVREIGTMCREHGVLFHSDAVQAIGRIPVNVDEWNVDLLSISAHKLYGPKGVGALYIRQSLATSCITPLVFGGGQEGGLRSGTLPVPLIVGLGRACGIARQRLDVEPQRLDLLRNTLRDAILAVLPDTVVHGHPEKHLPGLLSLGFPDVDGDLLIHFLSDVAASQGSSCSVGSFQPSHVLRAMGVCDSLAGATLRLGVGRFNTNDDIATAAKKVIAAVEQAREAAPPLAFPA